MKLHWIGRIEAERLKTEMVERKRNVMYFELWTWWAVIQRTGDAFQDLETERKNFKPNIQKRLIDTDYRRICISWTLDVFFFERYIKELWKSLNKWSVGWSCISRFEKVPSKVRYVISKCCQCFKDVICKYCQRNQADSSGSRRDWS